MQRQMQKRARRDTIQVAVQDLEKRKSLQDGPARQTRRYISLATNIRLGIAVPKIKVIDRRDSKFCEFMGVSEFIPRFRRNKNEKIPGLSAKRREPHHVLWVFDIAEFVKYSSREERSRLGQILPAVASKLCLG